MLQNLGVNVSAKAANAIATDGMLNYQQLLFMLNEPVYEDVGGLGKATDPGYDIMGRNKPSHQSKLQEGFQRQRADDFITEVIVPNFKPSKSNVPSASNPMLVKEHFNDGSHQKPQDRGRRHRNLFAITQMALSKGLSSLSASLPWALTLHRTVRLLVCMTE